MAVDTSKVRVAITGAVLVGVTGSPAPASASATPDVAYADLGSISEDGVTEAGDRSTNDIKIWQNGAVARTVVTASSITWKFVMVETNQRTQEEYYGSAYNSSTKSIVVNPVNSGGRKAYIIDVIDGTNLKRIYVPQGEVTDKGDIVYDNKSGDPIGYEVTVTGYFDSGIGGSCEIFYDSLAA